MRLIMGSEQATPSSADETVVRSATLPGRRFRVRDHYEVGREKIREFARAVRNDHLAHRYEDAAQRLGYPGLIAPPTFAAVIGMTGTRSLLDTVLTEYDLAQMVQTDQVFHVHRPIVAGDSIVSEIAIESIRQFGEGDFIHAPFVLRNQRAEVAVTGSTTLVARRNARVDPELAATIENVSMPGRPLDERVGLDELDLLEELDPLPAGTPPPVPPRPPVRTVPVFDSLAVGDRLPVHTVRLTRGDLVNYAGVSGDTNPIHFSDHVARPAGLPGVVAHGLLTMGLAAGRLTDWLGDPTAIEKFSVRFAGFVPVPANEASIIELSGRIKSLDPEHRMATVLLDGRSAGRKLFGRAVAEVRLS